MAIRSYEFATHSALLVRQLEKSLLDGSRTQAEPNTLAGALS